MDKNSFDVVVIKKGACMRVVAGVLSDEQGRVLVQKRPEGKALAGFWEFPGGKVCAGESDEQALVREFEEELGMPIHVLECITQAEHTYAHATVQVFFYRCVLASVAGDTRVYAPQAKESQVFRFASCRELEQLDFCEADRVFVRQLGMV